MMWFIDYLIVFFNFVCHESNWSLSKCCKKAYTKVLKPRHAIYLVLAAQAAWLAAPSRNKFYPTLFHGVFLFSIKFLIIKIFLVLNLFFFFLKKY